MKKAKKLVHWKWKSSYVINPTLPEDKRRRHNRVFFGLKMIFFKRHLPVVWGGEDQWGNQLSWLVFTGVAGARALSRSFGEISELVLRESGEAASWPRGRGATQLATASAWSLHPVRLRVAAAASLLAWAGVTTVGGGERSPRQNEHWRSLSKAPRHHWQAHNKAGSVW